MKFAGVIIACVLLFACGDPGERKGSELRLYHGAPPVVPHGVEEIGRRNCQACHARGYARANGRRAPITPHPERTNCRQCHVESTATSTFRENSFDARNPGAMDRIRALYRPANPIGPPYIPHRLQDRENCAACHLSETAPKARRPRHGRRGNCLQCHVPLDGSARAWARDSSKH